MSSSDTIKPSDQVHYYDRTVYWNDFAPVKEHINTLISGDANTNWIAHVHSLYGKLDTGFFLNCGNGWVEREFFQAGVIRKAVGVDIINDLLEQARKGAAAIGMEADYRVADCNKLSLVDKHDCIVNHAALHHVAKIDHVSRELCRGCNADGFLFSYDYVGPERNQYPWEMWSAAIELWNQMPEEFRSDMQYPHLPTMLHVDPTEAIHSDLIVPVLSRYFDLVEEKALGGALAYLLLFQNKGLFAAVEEGSDGGWLQRILDADQEFTRGEVVRSLFAYSVFKPRKEVLEDDARLKAWTAEEEKREAEARANGGRYGPTSALEIIYEQMDDYRRAAEQAT